MLLANVRPLDPPAVPVRRWLRSALLLALINGAVLLALLVPVELIFGTWIRPMALADLKRFSIPVGVQLESDVSGLYSGGPRNPIVYSRDAWGLRGAHTSPREIEVLTVGGSTTDQRWIDDQGTWQAVAERELTRLGRPMRVGNAGVDGQSSVGHLFSFDFWFPLVPELRPRVVLFYLGANDILRHEGRAAYDGGLDATSWRVRSATYQLLRTLRSNQRARTTRVLHGRMPPTTDADFTAAGLLSAGERAAVARDVTGSFIANIAQLHRRVRDLGAVPAFMTQTAFGWRAHGTTPYGLKATVPIHGRVVNYADVSFFHQDLNRALLDYCATHRLACFDSANDVAFTADDYYDYLHNSPRGAEKLGRYVAQRLAALPPGR